MDRSSSHACAPAHPSPAPQAAGTPPGPLHRGYGASVVWPRLGRAGSYVVWVCSVRRDTQACCLLAFHPDMRRDVQEIFRLTPHEKQCMMFSATLSKEIRPVCRKFMQDVSRVTPQLLPACPPWPTPRRSSFGLPDGLEGARRLRRPPSFPWFVQLGAEWSTPEPEAELTSGFWERIVY